jgi:hypothetical protein
MTTAIDICSNALLRLGENPINSFQDGTTEALVSANLYPRILKSTLAERRWSFAVDQKQLSKLKNEPSHEFSNQYQLPSDFIALIKTHPTDIFFKLYGGRRLLTGWNGELYVDYIMQPDEQNIPDYFLDYLEVRLAVAMAVPVTEDEDKLELMSKLEPQIARRARMVDSQQQPQRGFWDFPLLNVRGD